jgi:hypothetical protein
MRRSVFWLAFILPVMGTNSAIRGADPARPGEEASKFKLVILKSDLAFDSGGTAQDYPRVWERLATFSPHALFEVGIREIESYDWKRQSITLTAEATHRLVAALPSMGQMNPDARAIKSMQEKLGWGDAVGLSLLYKGFLVLVDGRPTYGGMVLEPTSQLAIRFPVLRFDTRDGKTVVNVMPVHVPFITSDPVLSAAVGDPEPVFNAALSDWRQFPQAIRDGLLADARSKTAKHFRELIMSPTIREALKNAGKLAR